MKDLKIENWPVERLRPYERNLKNADKALPQMMDALRQWGFRIPLLVTGDGEIIDGKTRYRAALGDAHDHEARGAGGAHDRPFQPSGRFGG